MSGHSKWHSIKHKKGAADAKRGKLFAVLIRQIEIAARSGGGDPASNATLRSMVQKARDNSLPVDTIQRAIKRGSGEEEGVIYEQVSYEGYAASGVAVIVQTLTDNRNRTSADVRAAFSKYGGALGETGSVSFMFDHVGVITYPLAKGSEDAMLEAALEAGANECVSTADGHEFLTSMEDFASVRDALEAKLGAPQSAAIVWRPQNMVAVIDDAGETLIKLVEVLDDHDDVQNVYGNYELSEALIAKLNA